MIKDKEKLIDLIDLNLSCSDDFKLTISVNLYNEIKEFLFRLRLEIKDSSFILEEFSGYGCYVLNFYYVDEEEETENEDK